MAARTLDEAKSRKHEFWATQPVPDFGDQLLDGVNEPIEEDKPV